MLQLCPSILRLSWKGPVSWCHACPCVWFFAAFRTKQNKIKIHQHTTNGFACLHTSIVQNKAIFIRYKTILYTAYWHSNYQNMEIQTPKALHFGRVMVKPCASSHQQLFVAFKGHVIISCLVKPFLSWHVTTVNVLEDTHQSKPSNSSLWLWSWDIGRLEPQESIQESTYLDKQYTIDNTSIYKYTVHLPFLVTSIWPWFFLVDLCSWYFVCNFSGSKEAFLFLNNSLFFIFSTPRSSLGCLLIARRGADSLRPCLKQGWTKKGKKRLVGI